MAEIVDSDYSIPSKNYPVSAWEFISSDPLILSSPKKESMQVSASILHFTDLLLHCTRLVIALRENTGNKAL